MKFILGLWIEMVVAGMGLGTTGVPVAGNYRERERSGGNALRRGESCHCRRESEGSRGETDAKPGPRQI